MYNFLASSNPSDLDVTLYTPNIAPELARLKYVRHVGVLAAMLLYKTISPNPDLTRRKQLIHLLLFGVIFAPLVASFLASFALTGQFTIPELHSFQHWFIADALGVAIVTPLCLSYYQREHFPDRTWREILGLFAVLCITSFLIFWQTRFPLLYLVRPPLLVMGTRMRLAGSALGLLLVSIIGGFLTTHYHGPVALSVGSSFTTRCLQLQLFVAVSMLILYIIEVLKAESSRLQFNLQTSETRFRLLAEVSHDIIVLDRPDRLPAICVTRGDGGAGVGAA